MAEFSGWIKEIHDKFEKDPEYITTGIVLEIIDNLADLMKKKGISRAELARRLGKSRGYVTKLMRGYYDNLTIKTLVELALALDEDVEKFQDLFQLFGDKEYIFPVFNLEKCFPKTAQFDSTSFLSSDFLAKDFSDTEFVGEEELANAA